MRGFPFLSRTHSHTHLFAPLLTIYFILSSLSWYTGAVCARLFVHDTPLCFVNSHLSSGSKEGDEAKRNADVAEILQRCDFVAASMYDQSMTVSSTTIMGEKRSRERESMCV